MSSSPIPEPGRPKMPDGYGVPETNEGLLDWSFVEEQMTLARNYWVSTTRPDGRPHAMPTWGVWLDGVFYFEGSPKTRRMRNIANNPAVVVHLESGEKVVILEGEAQSVHDPPRALTERLATAFSEKYAWAQYSPTPESWDGGGLYAAFPKVVMAWSRFPLDATRWEF